jgi:thymidylate synthase (FAD)
MQVRLIAITSYLGGDSSSAQGTLGVGAPVLSAEQRSGAERLIEHAGRICYRSQGKGTPEATARFIQKRVGEGHESIIEHASASFEISGISRACSHQIVRHRIASYSQESQRYVDMSDPEWVAPADIADDPEALVIWKDSLAQTQAAYRRLRERGIKKEDARFLLPNATATRLIMTANFRELLHIFRIRISPHAQWEIREVAVRMLEAIYAHAPNTFGAIRRQLRETYPAFFEGVDSQTGPTERWQTERARTEGAHE